MQLLDVSKLGQIQELEVVIRQLAQVDIPVKHYYANGFYAREMRVRAGTLLTGKVHKSEHLCIISGGSAHVASEEFTGMVGAPHTYVSQPGAKRAIYAIEDLVWTTVHMTTETDLDLLEDLLIEPEATPPLAVSNIVKGELL
jgi:hypothetical protein